MNPSPASVGRLRSIAETRGRFPALSSEWAFFDHAGGSPPSDFAIQRVARYMSEVPFQHGASYESSREAVERLEVGRSAAARLMNARPSEVALGPSSTVLAARLARALGPTFAEGDEIIVTNLDHEANIAPWRRLEERGLRVREWRFRDADQALHPEDLDELLTERTRLVACTHCSNLIGTVHDIAEIARRTHEAGALLCVDGVAFAPHRRIDVRALGADFYFFSTYKTYGPHAGALFVREDHLSRLASQGFSFQPAGTVKTLEPGSVSHELAAGLAGITDYLDWLAGSDGGDGDGAEDLERAWQIITEREREVLRPLLTLLATHPRVRLYGLCDPDDSNRVPTVSFTVNGMLSSSVPGALDEKKLALRFGSFYARRAVEALGLDPDQGVVRASLLHLNSDEEVARLVEALDQLL